MAMSNKSSCVVRQIENGYVLVENKYVAATATTPEYFLESETFYGDMPSLLQAVNAVFS